MFSPGQKVWSRNGKHSGTVLECEADRVYITQDNGAELDFHAGDLSAAPPSGLTPAAAARERAAPNPVPALAQHRTLTARDITPEHVRVLGIVPVRTLRAVAALFERAPNAGKFSALDVAGKLNAVAAITAIPYRTMREYSDRPGELGLLMGKGLADRSGAG